jgi:hypothetical protein
MDEVRARFVDHPDFAASTSRAGIWNEWQQATEVLHRVTPIASVWLSGSFTTTKLNPGDIDCLYWLDSDDVIAAQRSGDAARNILGLFANNALGDPPFSLHLDTFVASWRSIPEPHLADADDWRYWRDRGHWDDFWQRRRSPATEAGATPTRIDSLPRRGYLEVEIDGFTE